MHRVTCNKYINTRARIHFDASVSIVNTWHMKRVSTVHVAVLESCCLESFLGSINE